MMRMGAGLAVLLVLLAGCDDPPGTARGAVAAELSGGRFMGTHGVTLQAQDADCGPAVLHMLLTSRGIDVAYPEILGLHPDPEEFWSFSDLRAHAARWDLRLAGYRANLAGLAEVRLPAVAHLEDHFVLIDSIFPDRVHVRDPFVGRMEYRTEDFEDLWTGNVLVVSEGLPTPDP